MKELLYSKVEGRRAGDRETKYKFDWWKLIIGALLASLIGWGSWVTRMSQKAEKTEEIVDSQVTVLHNRISQSDANEEADETRLENRLWELQKRFYEDEISDCENDLANCQESK
jgi:hypothetical protein